MRKTDFIQRAHAVSTDGVPMPPRQPDVIGMLRARAEVDEHLNKVLVLLAPPPNQPEVDAEEAVQLIGAHLSAAQRALHRFWEAAYA